MLKALELAGFKSFADRTRFEFPRGVSVIVGPNGSGKSNVVDAVKWVLGSQSAKSLRGQDMVDVIFNGSASRGPLGTAEATLTFDNSESALPIDSREVHVTRRVYRSGEAEYLINRQPCRLRDIRDLLAGTGITTEAYCIIEQGKVDALLQSSARDRRVIFEEAAGVSQFKAKKIAAQRRLERVEQNLLRLSDIVDEVESRVRSVRSQAGKARRYRECATRLQELRTRLGLEDWRSSTEKLTARDRQLEDLTRRQHELETSFAAREAQLQELERSLETSLAQQRTIESSASAAREQIAAREAAIASQCSRRGELQQDVARLRRQLAAMNGRVGNTSQQLRDVAAEFRAAETELAAMRDSSQRQAQMVQQAFAEREQARQAADRTRGERTANERAVAQLANERSALQTQQSTLSADLSRRQQQLAGFEAQHAEQTGEWTRLSQHEATLAEQLATTRANLATHEQSLAHSRRELARAEKQFRQVEARLTRTRERISVLSELEQRLEGLDNGVQQVLQMARDMPAGPLGAVRGVVADLFHVDVDTAPLIEVALGERAQFVVLTTAEALFEELRREPLGVAGRVGFLRLDSRAPLTALDQIDLSAEPGVMGRADRFIETAPEYVPLVHRLMGRTWLVDRLATALRLMQGGGRGLEFVTGDGELLTADGTLVVGPRSAVIGILSRRSELRACHEQVAEFEQQLAEHETVQARLQQDCARHDELSSSCRASASDISEKLTEARQLSSAARVQLDHTERERLRIGQLYQQIVEQVSSICDELEKSGERLAAAEQAVVELSAQTQTQSEALAEVEKRHAQLQAAATEGQIAAARCEERGELLRHRLEQAASDQQERDRAQADTRQRLATRENQLVEQENHMLSGRQALAELYLQKEQHAAAVTTHMAGDESLRTRRAELSNQVRGERQQLTTLQSQRHKVEVDADRLRQERKSLCDRMQEDYGIDLAAVTVSIEQTGTNAEIATHEPNSASTADSSHAPIDRKAVEREITELRNQLGVIGPVNTDALEELDSLESRFNKLSGQHRDLVDAKATTDRIIQRINNDTRQLFTTTLETVRGHFQELFRRLFGGGEADIVLDDQEDVLESGIEIIARPPGKEACSISLLSGGEKTLTCVALLLAVFRSKPSPFCVLDEVDAALDEANIGRFVGVLRDFLSFTQFIVVTHSKRTMSGGDTMYGVTMEESGVSKRVAVRFEDVSEDGHIRLSGRAPAASTADAVRRAA